MRYKRSIRSSERGAALVEHSLTVVLIAVVVMVSVLAVSRNLSFYYQDMQTSLSIPFGGGLSGYPSNRLALRVFRLGNLLIIRLKYQVGHSIS